MDPISLLNGAFTSELVKGKNGKTNWIHTTNLSKIGSIKTYEGEEKEKPEFEVSREFEQVAVNRHKKELEKLSLTFVKFMKSAIKQ